MTDAAVLSELLALLDLSRDTVSFRVERLILAAIRRHRDERAVVVSARLTEVRTRGVRQNRSHGRTRVAAALLARCAACAAAVLTWRCASVARR